MLEEIVKSDYFGTIKKDLCGILSEYKFAIPYFEKKVEVYFGLEIDDDDNEIILVDNNLLKRPYKLPTKNELIQYECTLKSFLENIDEIIKLIKKEAFKYYKEKKEPYGYGNDIPLINNDSEHFEYMKDLLFLRILKDNNILLEIGYGIDEEHAMEILIKNNQVYKIDEAGYYVLMSK